MSVKSGMAGRSIVGVMIRSTSGHQSIIGMSAIDGWIAIRKTKTVSTAQLNYDFREEM